MPLTLSWRRPLSYRNQSIELLRKLMDWFLYDNCFRHETVKNKKDVIKYKIFLWSVVSFEAVYHCFFSCFVWWSVVRFIQEVLKTSWHSIHSYVNFYPLLTDNFIDFLCCSISSKTYWLHIVWWIHIYGSLMKTPGKDSAFSIVGQEVLICLLFL